MIYTFYSYKGGVGRTMALANIAELFYQSGKKVLMVDWDLEAPGLDRFLDIDQDKILEKGGIIDLLADYKRKITSNMSYSDIEDLSFIKPENFIIDIHPNSDSEGKLLYLGPGQRSFPNFNSYIDKLLSINWQEFLVDYNGELYIEWFRQEIEKLADIILIDSRTGFTEMGGICTHQLADVVVIFCSLNEQSLYGSQLIANSLMNPKIVELWGGRKLEVLVIPSRVEDRAEQKLLDKYRDQFFNLFEDFIPKDLTNMVSLWQNRIPYTPYHAFGEMVAVRQPDQSKYNDLARSYRWIHQTLSRMEATRLKHIQPAAVEKLISEGETTEEPDEDEEKNYQYLAKRYGFGYRKSHVQCIIEPNGSAKVFRDVEIEAYSLVSEIDTFINLPEAREDEESKEIEPGEIESKDYHTLELSVIDSKPGGMTAKIQIRPPLKTGEHLEYRVFEFVLPPDLYAINLSSEDYKKREDQTDYFGWHINRPTKEFILEVQFPPDSSPKDYHLQVKFAASAGVPTGEVPELEQRKLTRPTLHTIDNRIVMVSKIDYPLHGLIYMLGWLPKLKDE